MRFGKHHTGTTGELGGVRGREFPRKRLGVCLGRTHPESCRPSSVGVLIDEDNRRTKDWRGVSSCRVTRLGRTSLRPRRTTGP